MAMLIIYQIYFDALGKKGALGFMAVNAIVQFFMGLSIVSYIISIYLTSIQYHFASNASINRFSPHPVKVGPFLVMVLSPYRITFVE